MFLLHGVVLGIIYVLPIQCTICVHYCYYKAFKACAYYYQHNYYLINKE